ncbi:MAG TPA: cellulase family glycosylhydrolase [Thermoleophilaceae bacterium]|jgi:hypothetical protein
MPRRPRVRTTASAVLVVALLCTLAASVVLVGSAAGSPQPAAGAHAAKAKKKKKAKCTRYKTVRVKRGGHVRKVRHCVSRKKKCKRYKTVRVKRGHRHVKVRRCVHPKKKPAAAPSPSPGSGTTSGPLNGGLIYGLNSVNNDDATLSNVAGAGVTMARVPLTWSRIEPSAGQFSWSGYDSVVSADARHGITVLPDALGDPSWAESSSYNIPSSPAAYADFIAHAAARYGPGGTFWAQNRTVPYHPIVYWEIWNEPYWYLFNSNGADPGAYARLVKATALAARAANPQVKFLLEADLTGYPNASTQVEWISAMYSAVPDLNNYFDGVAVHPYSWPKAPDVYSPGDRWDFKRIGDIRAKFVAHGANNKGFWITEVGYPTCSGNSRCVSESAQASDIARIFQLVKTDYASFMQAVILYSYKDPSGQDGSDPEDWFGLIRSDGTPKPAWNALRQATGAG